MRVPGGSQTPELLPPALLGTCRHMPVSIMHSSPLNTCLKPYQNEARTPTRTARNAMPREVFGFAYFRRSRDQTEYVPPQQTGCQVQRRGRGAQRDVAAALWAARLRDQTSQTSTLEQCSLGQTVSQLLLTVFRGPARRFHRFECAV